METLVIAVDFNSGAAIASAKQMAQAVDSADQSVLKLADTVKQADVAIENLGATTQQTSEKVAESKQNWAQWVQEMDAAEEAAGMTEERIAGLSAETMSLAEQADKAGNSVKNFTVTTDDATKSTKSLVEQVHGLGVTYLAMTAARAIISEIRQETEKMIEASHTLQDKRFTEEQGTADLVRNLNLPPDAGGQAEAIKLATEFRTRTGTTTAQAVAILSQTQANGFDVMDGRSGQVNPNGMNMAETMAIFAGRMNIDPETAGKLMNIASLSGVHDPESLKGFLAQLQTAQRMSPVSRPQEFFAGMINATAPLLAQHVPFAQALGQYGSALTAQPDAMRAAEDTQMLTRLASGKMEEADDQQKLILAKAAYNAGIIPVQAYNEAKNRILANPETKKETQSLSDKSQSIQLDIRKDREETEKENDEIRHLTAESKRTFTGRNAREEKQHAIETLRDRQAAISTARESRTMHLNQSQSEFNIENQEYSKKIDDYALSQAYQSLSPSDQLTFLDKLASTMTPDQLTAFVRKVAPGRMQQNIVGPLSPAALAAGQRILRGASSPDRSGFNNDTARYKATNSLYQASAATAAQQSSELAAAGPSASYVKSLRERGASEVGINESKGISTGGFWMDLYNQVLGPDANVLDTMDSYHEFYASGEGSLNALAMYQKLRSDVNNFYASMTPEQRKRYPKMGQLIKKLSASRAEILANAHSMYGVDTATPAVEALASEFGDIMTKVKSDALDKRESVPSETHRPATTPTPSKIPAPTTQPSSGSTPHPATIGGPQSSTINIHIGNHFNSDSSLLDLPGRLEGTT